MNATESYLLTWFFMPQADQVFDSVLSGIGYEKGVDAETMPRLQVFFCRESGGSHGAWRVDAAGHETSAAVASAGDSGICRRMLLRCLLLLWRWQCAGD